jgi:hypothetical protein
MADLVAAIAERDHQWLVLLVASLPHRAERLATRIIILHLRLFRGAQHLTFGTCRRAHFPAPGSSLVNLL